MDPRFTVDSRYIVKSRGPVPIKGVSLYQQCYCTGVNWDVLEFVVHYKQWFH